MFRAMVVAGVACALAAGNVSAQFTPWQVGVTGGLALTNISFDVEGNAPDGDSKMSPFFGASVVYQSASPFGFETGLVYVSKGYSESDQGVDLELNIKYLEIPLLARYAFDLTGSAIRPVVMAGATLGFRTGCDIDASGEGVSVSVDCDDEGLDLNSFDMGLAARVGVDIPAGSRTVVSPTIRYTHGLTNIIDDAGDDSAKNTAFMFGLSVRFRL